MKERETNERASFGLETLWNQYTSRKSQDLRDQLIIAYLHLVKKISRKLLYTLPQNIAEEDLYTPGVIGLIRAIEKYDASFNAKFETYASILIKGAIIDELRLLDWVPKSVHKRAQLLEESERNLIDHLGRFPSSQELSKHLGITELELSKWQEQVRPAVMIPLDHTQTTDEAISFSEKIPDKKIKNSYEILEKRDQEKFLEQSILDLPEKERMVLALYYYEGMMLKEIGTIIGITESRVSQIHTKAIQRLRKRLYSLKREFMAK